MEILKKILTVMVIVLVVIVVGGGLYMTSMGSMNHGPATTAELNEGQTNKDSMAVEEGKGSGKADDSGQNSSSIESKKTEETATVTAPVIIQIPPSTQSTDASIYVNQLKEKLRSINEFNGSIAANSGGHDEAENMNRLHLDFYRLGKDIAAMETALNNLDKNLQNGSPYQQNQQNQPQLGNQQPDNNAPNVAQDNLHGNGQSGGHGTLGVDIFNSNTIKVILSIALLCSIIIGIVAVIGFVSSLFKEQPRQQQI